MSTSTKHEVGLRFHVRAPSGEVETLLVDSDRALIGAGAHCEVRLPAAAHEHVEIVVVRGVAYIETRAGAAPPLLDEQPFLTGPWTPGAMLAVGEHAIGLEVVDLMPKRRARSPLWALVPVPFLAGLAVLVAARSAPAADAIVPPAPALLDPVVAFCPVPNSPTLAAFAAERARVGYAKRERSPFSPGDGIEAVAALETASVCFRNAGLREPEHEVFRAAQALRARLEEEYHVRRVRLEHAFRVGDPVAAKRELTMLVPLTAHRRGPYVDWLGSVDRHATSALDDRSRNL